MSKKVLETLSRCQSDWGAEEGVGVWKELTGVDREKFLDVLVKDDGGGRLELLSSDLGKLGKLPLFETLNGEYVTLGENSAGGGSGGVRVNENYTLGADLSLDGEVVGFLPESALSKFIKVRGGDGRAKPATERSQRPSEASEASDRAKPATERSEDVF